MINCIFEDGDKASLRHVVVDVVVTKENKILLEKRSKGLLEEGKWGLIGGFVDRDETSKEAVRREAFEETGYRVDDIKLLTIRDNPDRPNEDRQNIALVFACVALSKEGTKDDESTDVKWFEFDKLPKKEEIAFDHYKDIQLYLDYKKNIIKLPDFGYEV